MQLRYLSARSRWSQPVVLPDGLRVIRMFPEWGGAGPLWESFTENYPADPDKLGLDRGLAAQLREWNDAWATEDAVPSDHAEWIAEGVALHRRVQEVLHGIAEVAPQFLPAS